MLKLSEYVLKVTERILEKYIRNLIKTSEMQFGFMPGVGTNDAIFITRKKQVKSFAKHKNQYVAFVDTEKLLIVFPERLFGDQW